MRYLCAVMLVVIAGCGKPASTEGDSAPSSSPAGTGQASPDAEGSSQTQSGGMQLVEGEGVRFQVPDSWRVLKVREKVSIMTSPDAAPGGLPIQLVITMQKIPESSTPSQLAEGMLKSYQVDKEVELESMITISGRPATRIVSRVENEGRQSIYLHVVCPTETAVLTVTANGSEEDMTKLLPQFDTIVESLELQ